MCGVDSILFTMGKLRIREDFHALSRSRYGIAGFVMALAILIGGCRSNRQIKVAVIPRTEGTLLWDPIHTGAEIAADGTDVQIYWTAPTREDDVDAQIRLVERVVKGNYQGLVLAPDQALSLITPVRRALAQGIPTVIIGSPLPIPAGGDLYYILNDDTEGGRMAGQRIAELLKGHGSVALLGINPDVTGIMIRVRAFEEFLAQHYPDIHVVERREGTLNVPHEQQVAEDVLRSNPNLDAIVAFMWTTVDGTLLALDSRPMNHDTKMIGFDAEGLPPFNQQPKLDSVIQENSRSLGQQAIQLIRQRRLGASPPNTMLISPKLITRQNIDSDEVMAMMSGDWKLGHWHWSSTR